MYLHALTFTKDDRVKLSELYNTLTSQLEKGKELKPEYFVELKLTMQTLLYGQKGLHGFWQEVQNAPHGKHHLHITHKDKELLNLPWQLAIDDTKYPFLYISKGLPGVHSIEGYKPQAGPLRILVMIASPEDLDHNMRLSYEEEEQTILKVLAPLWETGQVQVDFTGDGSLHSLQQQLQLQHYHILYFSGHGIYRNDIGYLKLENEESLTSEYVTAQQFGQAIKATPEHTPPLIILSSCETAKGHVKEEFRGIADELIYMGVPAVIAMAFNITDQYAILFTAHLYEELAKRRSLMEAYAEALSVMRDNEQQKLISAGQHQYYPSQWLVPQFYCSQQIAHIVDWQAPGQVLKVTAAKFIKGEEPLLLSAAKEYVFIGRRRESAFLFSKLTHNLPILLKGQGGVGKTAMAEHLAKRLITQDPARYCFAFNETNVGIVGMAARLKQYLENEGHLSALEFELKKKDDVLDQLELLLKEVTRFCKPLWIFDNMESCQEDIGGRLTDEHIGWMLYVEQQLLHRFPVIFTGRYPIKELPDIATVSLNQVSSVDFYRKCLQLNIRSVKTATLLYKTLGGSYRVLEFFNEIYKADQPRVKELLQQMASLQSQESPGKELMQEIQNKVANDGKRIVFSALLSVLTEQEQATLHLLLYFISPVLPKALQMQLAGKNFDADLQRLKDLTLIEECSQNLYYITPLVRDWLEEAKLPPVEFYPVHAGDYFIHAFNKITHNYADMERAFSYYILSRDVEKINETGAWIVSEYYRMGLYDLIFHFGRKVEGIAGVHTDEEVLNNIGLAYLKYDKFDPALTYLTKFLIATRRKGDKKKESTALNSISQVYYQQGNLDASLVWLEKSRVMATENGFLENEAITYTNLGNVYIDRKQFDNGLEAFRKSLKIRRATGNRQGEARVMVQISIVHQILEEHEKAIKMLQKALFIAVDAEEQQLEGTILTMIGLEYEKLGSYQTALPYLTEGLAVCKEIGDQEGIGRAFIGLGMVHKMLGNFNEATEYITKGGVILEKFGYQDMDANVSWHLGNMSLARGDYSEAITLIEESLPAARAGGDKDGQVYMLDDMAEAYLRLGEFDKAITCLEESTILKQSLGDIQGEIVALNRISQAYAGKEDMGQALKYQKKVLAIQKANGDNAALAMTYFNLALLYAEKGDADRFLKYGLQGYTINSTFNNLEGLYFTGMQLGFFLCLTDDPEQMQLGLWMLEQSYEIGIQSDYPTVEEVAYGIKKFTAKYNKKVKAKSKKALL